MKHIITCQLEVNVLKILDYDEDGYPITTGISTIIEKQMNQEVNDNEYDSISNVWLMRQNKYYSVSLDEVPGCELLFYRMVWDDWKEIIDKYNTFGLDCTIKNPHLYKIELPNEMLIIPSVRVTSMEPQNLEFDFDQILDNTQFSELPDGYLELVRVGKDWSDVSANLSLVTKIEKIGKRAFEGYKEPLNIDLPGCTYIDEYAFNHCIGLTKVNLPKIEIIQEGAFNECHFLTEVNYPEHIIGIGESAFYACVNLKHFIKQTGNGTEKVTTLPESIVSVKSDAFAYTPLDFLSDNQIYDPSIAEEDWD